MQTIESRDVRQESSAVFMDVIAYVGNQWKVGLA